MSRIPEVLPRPMDPEIQAVKIIRIRYNRYRVEVRWQRHCSVGLTITEVSDWPHVIKLLDFLPYTVPIHDEDPP